MSGESSNGGGEVVRFRSDVRDFLRDSEALLRDVSIVINNSRLGFKQLFDHAVIENNSEKQASAEQGLAQIDGLELRRAALESARAFLESNRLDKVALSDAQAAHAALEAAWVEFEFLATSIIPETDLEK